jgi:hypothetical protein
MFNVTSVCLRGYPTIASFGKHEEAQAAFEAAIANEKNAYVGWFEVGYIGTSDEQTIRVNEWALFAAEAA